MKNLVVKYVYKSGKVMYYNNSIYAGGIPGIGVDTLEEATRYNKVEMDSAFDKVNCNSGWKKSILKL